MSRKLKINSMLGLLVLAGVVWLLSTVTAPTIESTARAAAASAMPNGGLEGVYVRYDGVAGEALDEGHSGWSEVFAFNQGIRLPQTDATGSGRRAGGVAFEDVRLVKEIDKSSLKIAEAMCKGKVFPKVEIDVTASLAGQRRARYYRYELKNVMVTSYNVSAGTYNSFRPVEDVTLNFEEIKVTYTELGPAGGPAGNVEYSWKVEEGEG